MSPGPEKEMNWYHEACGGLEIPVLSKPVIIERLNSDHHDLDLYSMQSKSTP